MDLSYLCKGGSGICQGDKDYIWADNSLSLSPTWSPPVPIFEWWDFW